MNAFRVTATDRTEIVADYIFSEMAAAMQFVKSMVNKVDEVKVERITVCLNTYKKVASLI